MPDDAPDARRLNEAAMAKANEIKSKRMLGIDEDETEADNDNTKQLPKRIFADWLDCHIEGIRRNPSYSPATYRNYRSCVNIIKEYLKHRRRPRFLMSKIGREKVGKKGVVRDKAVHEEVIERIITFALENGFSVHHLEYSPIKGPEGNIEYLVHIEKSDEAIKEESVDRKCQSFTQLPVTIEKHRT